MSYNSDDIEYLKIDRQKLVKFQEWCAKNEINYLFVLEKVIDGCLNNNQEIINSLIKPKDYLNFQEKIETIINQSLQPLITRIENIESQLQRENLEKKLPEKEDIYNDFQEKYTGNRIYLTRQQVWQKLKKTDYVKYSGYDSFLKAKGEEFLEYGIFFDQHKKRFYLLSNE